MKSWSNIKYLLLLGLILLIISAACTLPLSGNGNQGQPTADLQATIVALQTEMAKSTSGDQGQSLTTATETISAQVTETVGQTPTPEHPIETFTGFMVFTNGHFISYDFEGAALGFDVPTQASGWIGNNDVSVFSDQVYYSEFGSNSGVFHVTLQGSQKLNFIDGGGNPVSIAVSPDGSVIAWSTTEYINNSTQTSLFLANIDGSNQRMISQIPAADQTDFMRVYYPYRWTEDGKLLYATALNGIGGYLLFWGYNGMFLYDTANDTNSTIIPDSERLGLCLSSISNDLSMAAIVCGNPAGVRVRHLSNGAETLFPVLADQVSAGSAKFSPSGEWLAYVIQRMNPDDELGKVVVVPTDGSSAPSIISALSGSFTVEGWQDEDTIIASHHDLKSNVTTIWRMKRDGSDIAQLTDGQFLGFIR